MRRGMTLAYAHEKRKRILQELRSDAHYRATDTIYYGEHDPFDVPLADCGTCGGKPTVRKVSAKPIRWRAVCGGCGNQHKAVSKWPWLAALNWNGINLASQDYHAFPMFGLSTLDPDAAREVVASIRRDLELRKALAGIETTIARKTGEISPPGRTYQQRLEAYLQWAMLALRLVKAEKMDQREEPHSKTK